MSELLHPGQHPDADRLSAFAEHVLPDHERVETLAHLAECPECRRIVFLAQEAEAPVPSRVAGRAGWLRNWRYVWPAAAVVACGLLIFAFRQRPRPVNVAQKPAIALESSASMPPSSAPAPQAVVPAPPSVVPAPPPLARSLSAAKVGSSLRPSSAAPLAGAEIGSVNGDLPASRVASNVSGLSREATTLDQQAPETVTADAHQLNGAFRGGFAQAAPPVGLQGSSPAARHAQTRDFQSQHQLFPQQTAAGGAIGGPVQRESANQTVEVMSAPPAVQTESAVLSASSYSGKAQAKASEGTLPSNRAVASSISNGVETLAVDSAGDLFLSKDGGTRWQRVAHQWTGKAVKVNLALPSAMAQTFENKGQAADATSSAAVESPAAVARRVGFELVTDSGAIWFSTDGLVWKQR